MRVLLVPVFNYPGNLNADSIYNISGDWAKKLVDSDDDMSVYRLLPELDDKDRVKRFQYNYKKVHDRVHDIFVPMYGKFDMEECNVDFELFRKFHPILGEYPVDAVVCTSAIKTVFVKRIFWTGGGDTYPPKFFNFELLIRGMDSNEVAKTYPEELLLQSVGETMGFNLFESPMCKRMATKCARTYVSSSMVKKIMENNDMVYSGYDSDEAFEVEDKEKEPFRIIVRGRLTNSKKAFNIVDLYNKFYAAGRNVEIIITTGEVRGLPKDIKEELHKNSNIKFMQCETKAEANEIMRNAHAFVFWSKHELFAVSVWEMLASGLVGIFKKEDWFDGLLHEDYPYIFDESLHAYTMLMDIYDNYDKIKKELSWVPKWVEETYAYKNTAPKSARLIRENTEPIRKPRPWLVEMMDEHGKDEMTLDDCIQTLITNADMGESVFRGKNPSRMHRTIGVSEIANAVKQAGYEENHTKLIPEFKRKKK